MLAADARRLALLAATAGALALGALGCGDDGGGSGATVAESRPTEMQPSPEQPLSPQEQRGRELFVENCGTCHTLEAAGTDGSIGPNLDEAQLDEQDVLEKITEGPGAMPSNLVTGEDAKAVAKFVAGSSPGV